VEWARAAGSTGFDCAQPRSTYELAFKPPQDV
jgi:hypothetical protein